MTMENRRSKTRSGQGRKGETHWPTQALIITNIKHEVTGRFSQWNLNDDLILQVAQGVPSRIFLRLRLILMNKMMAMGSPNLGPLKNVKHKGITHWAGPVLYMLGPIRMGRRELSGWELGQHKKRKWAGYVLFWAWIN
ncbi:hypothetical protein Droror1_Dr00001148 [Drosera rotundifolia]